MMSLLNKRLQNGFLAKLGRIRYKNGSAMPLSCTKQSFLLCGGETAGSNKNCDVPKGFKAILLLRRGCLSLFHDLKPNFHFISNRFSEYIA